MSEYENVKPRFEFRTFVKTFVESGTSVRPMDLKRGLESIGVLVERPIKLYSRFVES